VRSGHSRRTGGWRRRWDEAEVAPGADQHPAGGSAERGGPGSGTGRTSSRCSVGERERSRRQPERATHEVGPPPPLHPVPASEHRPPGRRAGGRRPRPEARPRTSPGQPTASTHRGGAFSLPKSGTFSVPVDTHPKPTTPAAVGPDRKPARGPCPANRSPPLTRWGFLLRIQVGHFLGGRLTQRAGPRTGVVDTQIRNSGYSAARFKNLNRGVLSKGVVWDSSSKPLKTMTFTRQFRPACSLWPMVRPLLPVSVPFSSPGRRGGRGQ